MSEQEKCGKVINSLAETREFIAATKNMFKIGFPDIVSDVFDNALCAISDAIILLKAQEPRVITLEEWDKWRHIPNGKRDPLYVQHSTGGWWILNYTNWMEIAFLTGEIRIWSSRPTDE